MQRGRGNRYPGSQLLAGFCKPDPCAPIIHHEPSLFREFWVSIVDCGGVRSSSRMMAITVRWESARRRWNDGAAAVEGALVISVLLALVLGVIDFGMTLWQWNTMSLAVEGAGRYVMVNNKTCTNASCGTIQLQTQFTNIGYSTTPAVCTVVGGVTQAPSSGSICIYASTPSPQTTPPTMTLGAIYAYDNIIVPLSNLLLGALSGPFAVTSQATFPLD
jgi:Flp pilus assembly protein TadG